MYVHVLAIGLFKQALSFLQSGEFELLKERLRRYKNASVTKLLKFSGKNHEDDLRLQLNVNSPEADIKVSEQLEKETTILEGTHV